MTTKDIISAIGIVVITAMTMGSLILYPDNFFSNKLTGLFLTWQDSYVASPAVSSPSPSPSSPSNQLLATSPGLPELSAKSLVEISKLLLTDSFSSSQLPPEVLTKLSESASAIPSDSDLSKVSPEALAELKESLQVAILNLSELPSNISAKLREVWMLESNYQSGISEAYKEIPVPRSVAATNVWTFSPAGFIYSANSSRADLVAYYERTLKNDWFLVSKKEINAETTSLLFIKIPANPSAASQSPEKEMQVTIHDTVPSYLPEKLNFQPGAYVYIHFINLDALRSG